MCTDVLYLNEQNQQTFCFVYWAMVSLWYFQSEDTYSYIATPTYTAHTHMYVDRMQESMMHTHISV